MAASTYNTSVTKWTPTVYNADTNVPRLSQATSAQTAGVGDTQASSLSYITTSFAVSGSGAAVGQYETVSMGNAPAHVAEGMQPKPTVAYQPTVTAAAEGQGQTSTHPTSVNTTYVAGTTGQDARSNENADYAYMQPTATQSHSEADAKPSVVSLQLMQPYFGEKDVIVGTPFQVDPRIQRLSDLLGVSILTTMCCNPIFGAVAIKYSFRVRSEMRNNNYDAAKAARRVSFILNVISSVLNFLCVLVIVFLKFTSV